MSNIILQIKTVQYECLTSFPFGIDAMHSSITLGKPLESDSYFPEIFSLEYLIIKFIAFIYARNTKMVFSANVMH